MPEKTFARIRDWVEPAHPAIVKLYDQMMQIYKAMRERQPEIDQAFDRIAQQIGFVVTTTAPVKVDVGEQGAIKNAQLDGDALKGTLFEKELSGVLRGLTSKPFSGVPAGTYRFYLIWFDALRLKLHGDWVEPAHFVRGMLSALGQRPAAQGAVVRPEVQEPAHWFDPGVAIAVEDAVVISAIDEVYPELRLAERISAHRLAIRRIRPEVLEPAHFRQVDPLQEGQFVAELRALLAKYQR